MIRRGYQFRAYPTEEQAVLLQKTFGCVRFVYNKLLEESKERYKKTGTAGVSTPAKLKPSFPFLKEVDSMALCNAQLHLKSSFTNFFEGIKNAKSKKTKNKVGFPKWKTRKRSRRAYTTNNINNNIRIEKGKLRLPKLGLVEVVFHRRVEGTLKSVTISQEPSGKYYVSILAEQRVDRCPEEGRRERVRSVLGLDLSFAHCAVLSSGERTNFQRFYREMEAKLRRANQRLHKKEKGSKNREKARRAVAILHEKIRKRRLDFLHQLSSSIAKKYSVVVVEDIALQTMSRRFGKSVSDIGFGHLKVLLGYKLEAKGGKLYVAPKYFPSTQQCSACQALTGPKGLEGLKIRSWCCRACHVVHDRDKNAAKNLVTWYLETYGTIAAMETGRGEAEPNACGDKIPAPGFRPGANPIDETRKIEEPKIPQAPSFTAG
jgi:putative transposase